MNSMTSKSFPQRNNVGVSRSPASPTEYSTPLKFELTKPNPLPQRLLAPTPRRLLSAKHAPKPLLFLTVELPCTGSPSGSLWGELHSGLLCGAEKPRKRGLCHARGASGASQLLKPWPYLPLW